MENKVKIERVYDSGNFIGLDINGRFILSYVHGGNFDAVAALSFVEANYGNFLTPKDFKYVRSRLRRINQFLRDCGKEPIPSTCFWVLEKNDSVPKEENLRVYSLSSDQMVNLPVGNEGGAWVLMKN